MSTAFELEVAGRRAKRPGIAYLEHAFALMYPAATVAVRRMPGGPAALEWALLPTARNPSMLIPLRPASASSAALDELSTRGHRHLESAVRLGWRLGVLNFVPRLTVRRVGEDIQSIIAGVLGCEHVALSMVVGRTRALQKPVLRVLGPEGATVGFAKVGISEVTRALVRREAEVLKGFEIAPPRQFSPPAALAIREFGEVTVLVQEPLRPGSRPDEEAVRRAAVEIANRGSGPIESLRGSPYWAELRARVTGLSAKHEFAEALKDVTRHIESEWGKTPVRSGLWHGDFTEWNMSWDGSALRIWDWEGCTGPVPAGFDLLHYRFQGDVVVHGRHPQAAFERLLKEAADILSPWEPADPPLIVTLYLIHLVAGLIETGDAETRISRLAEWLPSALRIVMGRRRG